MTTEKSHHSAKVVSSPEEELHFFKFMADNVSDFVGMCDLQFQPFYINRSGVERVGLDKVERWDLIEVKDFFFEEDQRMIVNEFFPQVVEKGIGEIEVRFRHFVTGEPIWMLYYVNLLKNVKGDAIGYATISRDITKHKLFERAIVESEERFRNLADQAPMLVWMVDENARITYANQELLKFLDIPHYSEVAVQGGWEQVTHPDDIQKVYSAFMQGLENRTPYTVEARLFNANINQFEWFLFKAAPRFISSSTFAGFIGTAFNINAQKVLIREQERLVDERTRELKVANSQLERSNHELEQFAYIASHDLQEPLRKIQTFALLADERYADVVPREVVQYLRKIQGSASRMSDLIKDLLEFSILSHDRVADFRSTDLNEIINNVISDFEVSIDLKNIKIQKDELPVIDAVPLQMNQLFFNLIGNAIKFSRNEVESTIKIGARMLSASELGKIKVNNPARQHVVITVEDNGIGFSAAHSEKIFTIFQRLNDKKLYGGYGIGLALCRKIVDNHGGMIYASGKENVGSTFTIILPTLQTDPQ